MKKIVPLKYVISIIIFTMIIPVSIAVLLIILLENKSDLINAIIMFLFFCPFMGIVILLQNDVNVIINFSGEVTNNIWNWNRELKNLKEMYYTNNKNEIYKIFRRKHIPHKLLVFVFNNQEIKCIPMDLFTNKQINMIINTIKNITRS